MGLSNNLSTLQERVDAVDSTQRIHPLLFPVDLVAQRVIVHSNKFQTYYILSSDNNKLIQMRRLVRSSPMQKMGRNSMPAFDPEASNQKLKNWTNRLSNLASTGESKMYLTQLGALVNYYNRGAVDTTQVHLSASSGYRLERLEIPHRHRRPC